MDATQNVDPMEAQRLYRELAEAGNKLFFEVVVAGNSNPRYRSQVEAYFKRLVDAGPVLQTNPTYRTWAADSKFQFGVLLRNMCGG